MPKNSSINSILIIGSGPIVIGQACEFDYSGSQAARSLREEGIEVTLINSNPATIMTDKVVADNIYLRPLEVESIRNILQSHKIDAVLPTMGGQTALNLCIECSEVGLWEEFNVDIIGVDIDAIEITENRQAFRKLMDKIDVPMAPQLTAKSFLQGKEIAQEFGFPLCIRPSYTLGGSGASFVHNEEEFESAFENCEDILRNALPEQFDLDPEVEAALVDASLEFSQCMRDQGIDFPDPKPGEFGFFAFRDADIDFSSEAVQDAFEICQPENPLEDLND